MSYDVPVAYHHRHQVLRPGTTDNGFPRFKRSIRHHHHGRLSSPANRRRNWSIRRDSNAPWNLASPAGLEPACLCVRSAVLIRLSYGEMARRRDSIPASAQRLAPIAGIEPASSPVNGRPRAPCSPDGNKFLVENPGVEPGTPILQGSAAAAAFPVPGRGFEPRSPRLQRGAFTRLAYQADWRGCR